jgi:hypothetical protein
VYRAAKMLPCRKHLKRRLVEDENWAGSHAPSVFAFLSAIIAPLLSSRLRRAFTPG